MVKSILLIALIIYFSPILIAIFIIGVLPYLICEHFYFKSEQFQGIKNDFEELKNDFNALNKHIEQLKRVDLLENQTDYGDATITDTSGYNYSRKAYSKYANTENVYHCSRQVVSNAKQKPFEYIMKYFGLSANEETLEYFENMLNNFSAVEQGKDYLLGRQEKITAGVKERLPFLIRKFSYKKAMDKIGFRKIDLQTVYFPSYTFQYVSPGGNASIQAKVVMDPSNIERFITLVNGKIKWRKSIAGQRALMTRQLRETIKKRDHYACKKCKNSTTKEPNLLLEIDHIKPLSKGGMTTEKNLQTLCWRCNRSKGAKYEG